MSWCVCVPLQSQSLLGQKYMEALHIKSVLNQLMAELTEASALAKEQHKELQVLSACDSYRALIFSLLQLLAKFCQLSNCLL